MIGDRVYHWWCPRCEVRKFSDGYRLTYLYAFRRLHKALRNVGLEVWRSLLRPICSTIVERIPRVTKSDRSVPLALPDKPIRPEDDPSSPLFRDEYTNAAGQRTNLYGHVSQQRKDK